MTPIILPLIVIVIVIVIVSLSLNWYIAPTTPGKRNDVAQTLAQVVAGVGFFGTLYFTWRTVQVNREGQVTERFTRAIEQLGDDKLEIRLGGIYALERISRDSMRDYGSIMEVLTAYVRDKALWPGPPTKPPTDIQAVLTVLGRRAHPLPRLDLNRTNLQGANLQGAVLQRAVLRGADLQGADLQGAIRLTQEQIAQAIIDDTTMLPEYLP